MKLKSLKDQVWVERRELLDQVYNQISRKIWNLVCDKVSDHVWRKIYNQISIKVRDQLKEKNI